MEANIFYLWLGQSEQKTPVSLFFEMQNEFLKSVYSTIENNIDSRLLSVGFLAKNIGVSKSTLNRRLLNLTGLSTNELIRQYRLKKAAVLLLAGKNVSEAAYLTGFETPSYFSQCFKKFYEIAPKKYAQGCLVRPVNNQPPDISLKQKIL